MEQNPAIVEQFIDALGRLEESRDPDALVGLFAEGSDIGNVLIGERLHGPQGAREFWTSYRDTFSTIRSTFRQRFVTEEGAALEWTSEGTVGDGSPFRYDGVSILEVADGKIRRFRAYFDPRALGRQIEEETSSPGTSGRQAASD